MSVHTHVCLSFKCIIIQFAAYTATDGCTLVSQGVTSQCRLGVYCYCVPVCLFVCFAFIFLLHHLRVDSTADGERYRAGNAQQQDMKYANDPL